MQKISKRVLAQRAKGPPPPRHNHRAYWMWRRARVALRMKTCVRYVKRNARPVRTDGPPRDSGTHEAVVGREGDA